MFYMLRAPPPVVVCWGVVGLCLLCFGILQLYFLLFGKFIVYNVEAIEFKAPLAKQVMHNLIHYPSNGTVPRKVKL